MTDTTKAPNLEVTHHGKCEGCNEYLNPMNHHVCGARGIKAPGIRERIAVAISGAPFPSAKSLAKADAALAVVLEDLVSGEVIVSGAEALALVDCQLMLDQLAEIVLTAAATHLKGETDADA